MADTDTTDSVPEENESEQFREKYSSGWLALTRNESVTRIVDALLDLPPYREFNKTELADEAGVSRQSVTRHVDLLVEVGSSKRSRTRARSATGSTPRAR